MINVAIVEDDPRVRALMVQIVSQAQGCHCLGAYGSAEDALAAIPASYPDVVFMDIDLPGMNGVECVRRLTESCSGPQIIMLTVFKDTDSIFNALAAGAVGYLVKPVRAGQLIDAIRDVYGGGAPMTSSIARRVVQAFQQQPSTGMRDLEGLSPREMEVLDLLAQGFLYKEIADQFGVSFSTIRTHIERIYHKLHVRSRAQAVARYLGPAEKANR